MKETLHAYLPLIVRRQIESTTATEIDSAGLLELPLIRRLDTVALFADISGFTKLSEEMAAAGNAGGEHLAKHLNSYFGTMVRLISRGGGDVFKYAGDAMIVLWPEQGGEDVATQVRRAMQCALEIQEHLNAAKLDRYEHGVQLSCKVGVGCGTVTP